MSDSAENFTAFARAALPAYGLAEDTPLKLLNVSENGTFRIDDPVHGPSALRVHRANYHSREAIASELAWVTALRQDGVVHTPAHLPTASGDPIATARLADGQERYAVRFEWVDGHEPDESRLVADFSELGAITARLHGHARNWRKPDGFTRFVWDYDTSLGARGLWGRWQDGLGMGAQELAQLSRLDDALRGRLEAFGKSEERFGLVHADMRLANLMVNGDRVNVIDFDDCGLSWFLYDLATAVSFIEHEPYVPALLDAWVQGYRTVAHLSAEDEAEIGTFVMLRRLLLVAWIGSHAMTETAQEMGPEFTTTTCDLAESYLATLRQP